MERFRSLTSLALVALAGCGSEETGHENVATSGSEDRKILRIAYEREIDVLNAFTSHSLLAPKL